MQDVPCDLNREVVNFYTTFDCTICSDALLRFKRRILQNITMHNIYVLSMFTVTSMHYTLHNIGNFNKNSQGFVTSYFLVV